ncbi:hypothetical protein [Sporotomaculum syntrophicum]|uniref:hypothetical protein n=1 Tax=Sporotomaculum syntrophicum TaxID=182264 RepID=UPI00137A5E1B|nr:hypothetical protein [Sporotomaculum syntrophicum]
MSNIQIDDLLILELDAAIELCRSAGWQVKVEVTLPPRGELTGQYRVIRVRELSVGNVILTVAKEVSGKEV